MSESRKISSRMYRRSKSSKRVRKKIINEYIPKIEVRGITFSKFSKNFEDLEEEEKKKKKSQIDRWIIMFTYAQQNPGINCKVRRCDIDD